MEIIPYGVTRRLDGLGRVVLPVKIRRLMGWNDKDPLEIYTEEDFIVLEKFAPSDIFTGAKDNLIEFNGKIISKDTFMEMAKVAGYIACNDAEITETAI